MKNLKLIISILLLILWLLLIFIFSSKPGKESDSQSYLVVEHIFGANSENSEISNNASWQEMDENFGKKLNFIIRKLAHIGEYFILSLLVINVIIQFKGKIEYKHYIISICFCLIYAITDEFHQTFVPGRCGQVIDVFIDTFGAVLGCCMFKLIIFRKKSNIEGR